MLPAAIINPTKTFTKNKKSRLLKIVYEKKEHKLKILKESARLRKI